MVVTAGIAQKEDGLRQRVKKIEDPIFWSRLRREVPFLPPSFPHYPGQKGEWVK